MLERPAEGLRSYTSLLVVVFAIHACAPSQEAPPPGEIDSPPEAVVAHVPSTVAASDGVSIAYETVGAGETAIVLIHGWACDRSYWSSILDGDLGDSFRLVAVDLPGHGEAGLDRVDWTIERYGDDIATVVEHLELSRVLLVGHSMGGAVILEAAPRLGSRVVGLIPVDSLHNVGFQLPEEQWQGFLDAYRADYAGSCATMVSGMFREANELAADVQEDMCTGPQEVGLALLEQFGRYDAAGAMRRVEPPIRAINAEYSLPTEVEANREFSPTFDATIQAGVGHFPMLEAPVRFEEILVETIAAIEAEVASESAPSDA